MRLIANSLLYNREYGQVEADRLFDAPEDIGRELVATGKARVPVAPRVLYETKVIVPEAPEVSARLPFRDLSVSDQESPAVAPASHRLLPIADVCKPGTIDRRGRRGRARSGSLR